MKISKSKFKKLIKTYYNYAKETFKNYPYIKISKCYNLWLDADDIYNGKNITTLLYWVGMQECSIASSSLTEETCNQEFNEFIGRIYEYIVKEMKI